MPDSCEPEGLVDRGTFGMVHHGFRRSYRPIEILSQIQGRWLGTCRYDPQMMVSLLLYAYCQGVRSSRQIERACEMDVAFRVITANQKPDYSTVCRFRSQNEEELGMLFTQALRLCAEAGLVRVGLVALDGTKVKANASLSANRTEGHIEAEVRKMLAEAREKDEEEDRLYGKDSRGDEIPEELKDRRTRLAWL